MNHWSIYLPCHSSYTNVEC